MIHRSELRLVGAGHVLMLSLFAGGGQMILAFRVAFLGIRLGICSAAAAVEAGAVPIPIVVDDRPVVGVVDVRDVYVVHGAVVGEDAAPPESTKIANADVAKTVIDSAVESDVRAPVASMPTVEAITPTPVAGRPQETDPGRTNPSAGNPIIIIVGVCPVTRCPNVAIARTDGLRVNRQSRRTDANGKADRDLRGGCGRNDQHHKCEQ